MIPGSGRSAGEEVGYPLQYSWASLVTQLVKNAPAMQETWVLSLSWEDPGERENPLQYPGLENSMDCILHGVTKSWTRLSDFHFASLLHFRCIAEYFNYSPLILPSVTASLLGQLGCVYHYTNMFLYFLFFKKATTLNPFPSKSWHPISLFPHTAKFFKSTHSTLSSSPPPPLLKRSSDVSLAKKSSRTF